MEIKDIIEHDDDSVALNIDFSSEETRRLLEFAFNRIIDEAILSDDKGDTDGS